MRLDMRDPGNALCWSGPSALHKLACHMSAGRSVALNISMDGSTGSQLSARSAQLEAARAQAAQRLSQRQHVLSRKRREAALAAKAAMIERMQRDIAAADAEIQVRLGAPVLADCTWHRPKGICEGGTQMHCWLGCAQSSGSSGTMAAPGQGHASTCELAWELLMK